MTRIRHRIQFHYLVQPRLIVVELGPPARSEYVKWLCEYVVVDETTVDGKQTHEEDDVATAEEQIPDLVVRFLS